MELTEKLAKRLAEKWKEKPMVVAVCGAADLGKSYQSGKLVEALRKLGLSAEVLRLDSYLMARQKRIAKKISGYQPEAHNLDEIEADLKGFFAGKSIEKAEYDHSVGMSVGPKQVITLCSVLVIEGLHAMHEKLLPYISYSIFLSASEELLMEIRHEADIIKRKQSEQFSRINLHTELENYKKYVDPYRSKADIVLTLKAKWYYTMC
ncbi:hypothetical protein KCM76_12730 [Zooshikella marina]|uniref:uridine kinase family protein n=1 Tax=Zooshikella ganghwensis TaxID=202772 RepID=UPI001BB09973|nr:hypothetical protein [Zooshikella ganghwensis]MBU2706851.1 hypothetical protein [Zooshikella ganghwensis]